MIPWEPAFGPTIVFAFLSSIVVGATSFGSAIAFLCMWAVSPSLSIPALDFAEAVSMTALFGITFVLLMALSVRTSLYPNMRLGLTAGLTSLAGVPVGFLVLSLLDPNISTTILGMFFVAFALLRGAVLTLQPPLPPSSSSSPPPPTTSLEDSTRHREQEDTKDIEGEGAGEERGNPPQPLPQSQQQPTQPLSPWNREWWEGFGWDELKLGVACFIAGAMSAAWGINGPPIMAAFSFMKLGKDDMRAVTVWYNIFEKTLRIALIAVGFGGVPAFKASAWPLYVFGLIVSFLGYALGHWLQRYIRDQRRAVQLLLIIVFVGGTYQLGCFFQLWRGLVALGLAVTWIIVIGTILWLRKKEEGATVVPDVGGDEGAMDVKVRKGGVGVEGYVEEEKEEV